MEWQYNAITTRKLQNVSWNFNKTKGVAPVGLELSMVYRLTKIVLTWNDNRQSALNKLYPDTVPE